MEQVLERSNSALPAALLVLQQGPYVVRVTGPAFVWPGRRVGFWPRRAHGTAECGVKHGRAISLTAIDKLLKELHVVDTALACGAAARLERHAPRFPPRGVALLGPSMGVCALQPTRAGASSSRVAGGGLRRFIVYGPPGIGKSTAALLLISVYKYTIKPFSYASHRADYGQKPSADHDNNVCMYQDEAPSWLVDTSKLATGDAEKITQKKEQKSSGKMVGERMCQNPNTGTWATLSFNGDVFNNPEILNTNSAEKSGDGPLLNRYNLRYFMAGRYFMAVGGGASEALG